MQLSYQFYYFLYQIKDKIFDFHNVKTYQSYEPVRVKKICLFGIILSQKLFHFLQLKRSLIV